LLLASENMLATPPLLYFKTPKFVVHRKKYTIAETAKKLNEDGRAIFEAINKLKVIGNQRFLNLLLICKSNMII